MQCEVKYGGCSIIFVTISAGSIKALRCGVVLMEGDTIFMEDDTILIAQFVTLLINF